MKITGYTRSSGRFCQSAISSRTRSVIFELVSRLISVEYTSIRCASTSPVVRPSAVSEMTIESTPSRRRWFLRTVLGSKLPSRTRGISRSMGPTSVITYFVRDPLRLLPWFRPSAACFG